MKRKIVALFGLCLSCSSSLSTPPTALLVTVRDPSGSPLPDAAVQVDGSPVGSSNSSGIVETRVPGPEGRRVTIAAVCPEGYKNGEESEVRVPVREMRSVSGERETAIPMRESLICIPTSQLFVLVVNTDQEKQLPILARGSVAAHTDSDGVGQTVIGGEIGEEIEIILDTSSHPELLPRSPSRRFTSCSRFAS